MPPEGCQVGKVSAPYLVSSEACPYLELLIGLYYFPLKGRTRVMKLQLPLEQNENFPAVHSVITETADFTTKDIEIELRPAPIDRGRNTKISISKNGYFWLPPFILLRD